MKGKKFVKIVTAFLALTMAFGTAAGLNAGMAEAYGIGDWYMASLPSDYDGLGYFMKNYMNEKPQIVNDRDYFALADIHGRIVDEGGKTYLYFTTDYEISLYPWQVWDHFPFMLAYKPDGSPGIVTKGVFGSAPTVSSTPYIKPPTSSVSPNLITPMYNTGNSYTPTTNKFMWYGGAGGPEWSGPDGTIKIVYDVNGHEVTDTSAKIELPPLQQASWEYYYSNDRFFKIEIPSKYGKVNEIHIKQILNRKASMTVTRSGSELFCINSAGVLNKTVNGSNTDYRIQINATAAESGIYEFTFGYGSTKRTAEVQMSKGSNSVVVDVTIPTSVTYLYISKVVRDGSTEYEGVNDIDVEKWGYAISHKPVTAGSVFDYENPITGQTEQRRDYTFEFDYTINKPGYYKFVYAYYRADGTSGTFDAIHELPAGTGTFNFTWGLNPDIYKLRLRHVISPTDVYLNSELEVFSDESQFPSAFNASVNVNSITTGVYTIADLSIDYAAPKSGNCTVDFECTMPDGTTQTQSRTMSVNRGFGTFTFGNTDATTNCSNPIMFPNTAVSARLTNITDPDGVVHAINKVLFPIENNNGGDPNGQGGQNGQGEDPNGQGQGQDPNGQGQNGGQNQNNQNGNGGQNQNNGQSGNGNNSSSNNGSSNIGSTSNNSSSSNGGSNSGNSSSSNNTGNSGSSSGNGSSASADPTGTTGEPGVAGFVERLYTVALGRPSDPAGKADWINRVTTQGYTGADLAEGFLYSAEFLSKNMSNSDFLDVLYKTFFNRDADEAGKANWMNAMAAGMTPKQVIRGFIDSTEWANLCLTYGIASGTDVKPNISITPSQGIVDFATRLYTTCLGRQPDQGGLQNWANQLANMQISGSEAAHGFFFSAEFINDGHSNDEYVTRLYRTFMNREPDPAGFADWVGQLNNGASRESVFQGFAGSAEWADICAQYGILK